MIPEITNKIEKLLSKGVDITESETVHLMTLMGKIIELNGIQDDYPMVNFFRDWTQHVNIDRSRTGLDVLSAIHEVLRTVKDLEDIKEVTKALEKVLSLDKFLEQSQKLIKFLNIKTTFFITKKSAESFLGQLFEVLNDCPIRFPKNLNKRKKAKKIYENMMTREISGKGIVKELRLKIDFGKNKSCCANTSFAGKRLVFLYILFSGDDTPVEALLIWPKLNN